MCPRQTVLESDESVTTVRRCASTETSFVNFGNAAPQTMSSRHSVAGNSNAPSASSPNGAGENHFIGDDAPEHGGTYPIAMQRHVPDCHPAVI